MAFANAGVVNNLCAAAHFRSIEADPGSIARAAAGYVLRACAADPSSVAAIEARCRDDGA